MAAVAGPKDTKILRVRNTTLRANRLFYNVHKPNDVLGIRRHLPTVKVAMATVCVRYGTEKIER